MSDISESSVDEAPHTGSPDQIDETPPVAEDSAPRLLPFITVGLGASAGGVEALSDLFSNLPTDTGMAFVVVPHLAPDQKSHLVEILARKTSMPVAEVQQETYPQPNHVYVLPPKAFVSMSRGTLELHSRPVTNRAPMPIDHFFRSLAADQKNRAVAVVLSGTDSDGTLGLNAVKGEGGITMVQHPDSALFPGMPLSGIAGDHVDVVEPPARIAAELAHVAARFVQPKLQPLRDGVPIEKDEEPQLTRILSLLRNVAGVDFRLYKPSTIERRIARRLVVRKIESLAEYAKFLQTHPEELRLLHEETLINVTQFFRDPDVFQALKSEVLPKIFEQGSGDQVRFWIAGCSTGEEAYSLAICVVEYLAGQSYEAAVQIFGTDASEPSIQIARAGIYPQSIAADVSPERLRRFFSPVDKNYQVSKRLRDMCIFARQNLCHDPPFSRIDLISCRNVLIYFGQALQRQLIPTFNYALRSNGYLLLGTSESIREFTDLFTLVDRKHKIYAKVASATPAHFDLPQRVTLQPLSPTSIYSEAAGYAPVAHSEGWTDVDLQRAVDRLVLTRYGPAGLVVNERLEILQSRGQVGPFLEMAPGAVSLQLLRMLHESIAAQVRDAVRQAIAQNVAVEVSNLELRNGRAVQRLAVEVLPLVGSPSRSRCYLILFKPEEAELILPFRPELADGAEGETAAQHERYIARLQQDITSTKLYLQSLIEERDIKNQELTSANEEIQSANEELQSTNEELETTKEELQSSNEELQTINEEVQQRNAILTQTANDLMNLLKSVSIPVLMLNNELRIRQFTPLTQRFLNVRDSDIGRKISDIRLNLSIENLEPILREVIDTLATREMEVQDGEGCWHLLRVRPYRTSEDKIEGVVLVLIDVDQLRKSQLELRQARDFAHSITKSMDVPIVVLNTDLKIRIANDAFRSLAGLPEDELTGRSFPDLIALMWNMESIRGDLEKLRRQEPGGVGFEAEHELTTPEYRAFGIRGRGIQADGERALLLTFEDITARKRAEGVLAREREQLEGTVRSTVQALGRTQEELRALSASLFTAQDEERRRVARELHDDISQKLAVLGMDLERLRQNVPEGSEARNLADSLYERAGALSEDVRQISHRLHPSILDDLGLPYALKALGDTFSEREKMVVTFHRLGVPDHVPRDIAAALYRIAQEALRNVEKHAGKTHVKITLEGTAGGLRLEIADFGEGFNMDETHHGLGLITMSERAHLVQGRFSIESALGKGTAVCVEVPLSSQAATA